MRFKYKPLVQIFPYGAPELQGVYNAYLAWATTGAIIFHLLLLGSWMAGRVLSEEPEGRMVRIRVIKDVAELGPPPSIAAATPAIAISTPVARPSIGVPVPVPDALITPDATFATQEEMSQFQAPLMNGEGAGGDTLIVAPDALLFGNENDEPGMDEFVPFQMPPMIVKRVEPIYPELARKAGMQGKIVVKALVDREGRVKKVAPIQGHEIFHEAATQAVIQWVFKPALQQNEPVAVWVAIPLNFVLRDAQKK
jgi:protein TonB